jgi:uncharacterized surface protein with fasciclin (FAS1) repeats
MNNPSVVQTKNLPTNNLVETAAANGSFNTFGKLVESAGLGDTLRGPGPFTVFAPTDAAFEKLPAGKIDALLQPENKVELTSIINYHLLKGRNTVSDIGKWVSANTINGQAAPVKLDGETLRIDGAEITSADIGSTNGVIHGIDKVIMPNPPTTKQ